MSSRAIFGAFQSDTCLTYTVYALLSGMQDCRLPSGRVHAVIYLDCAEANDQVS